MSAHEHLAKMIDYIECPECGAVGQPSVAHFEGGFVAVIPRFQCETEGCEYNRDGSTAWTLALSG